MRHGLARQDRRAIVIGAESEIQRQEQIMTVKIRKRTPAEIEADVERYSQLGKQFAAICEGKDSEDVFYGSLLFFGNNYAMNLGEERRVRLIRMVHAQLFEDAHEAVLDEARKHWRECVDCRPDLPCPAYFKVVEPIADAAGALTLRVNSDGSFELSDQPCPHEG
jgi:hypothetical protein